jgi:hypothetical protein
MLIYTYSSHCTGSLQQDEYIGPQGLMILYVIELSILLVIEL